MAKFDFRNSFRNIMFFFSIIGPGIISAVADNDAGGITTFSVAGASYGYSMFWTIIPLALLLIIVQEMCARMGVVTGKGLADLIRENVGLRTTVLLMIGLFVANFGTTVAEFAGITAAAQIFGLNKYLVVFGSAVIVLFLIIRVNYKYLERVFLGLCLFYVTYILSGILAHPDWPTVGWNMITPTLQFGMNYWIILVGILGTSITPWMQFYLQSAIVEKGVKLSEYVYAKWEIIISGIISMGISFFIMLAAAATLFPHGIHIETADQAAIALEPFAGHLASMLFAVGLFAAAFFGAFILPLSTAYYICEAFGWESGVNKKYHEAPKFYVIIVAMVILSAMIVLIPNVPLIPVIIISQVVNGLALPFVLVAMLYLINKEKIMGEHVNSRFYNIICWGATVLLILVTMTMVGATIIQMV
ncbi:MAG: Nramp family divalent metal transporter [Candidatus Woesearchaeota archaeon]|jgi:Mn2+/Fe2+ NRAMP family transporter